MTGRLLDDLNDEDRAVLVDALDLESGITHAQIARALVSQGHRIGQHVRVEVAVGTLAHAPGQVHVDRERFVHARILGAQPAVKP